MKKLLIVFLLFATIGSTEIVRRYTGSGSASLTSNCYVVNNANPDTEMCRNASTKTLEFRQAETKPGAATAALAGLGAGNVNSGVHSYEVTFVTATGETEAGTASSTVTTTGGNGQVALSSIPTGTSGVVTSRKIYRTAAGGSSYLLLATIANNSTTTYADNIADASLTTAAPSSNTTMDPRLTMTQSTLLFNGGALGGVTSVATTSPITGGTITGTGTIACATCATTTNGGAISGTSPIAVSAGGAISLGNLTGDITTSGGAATTLASTVSPTTEQWGGANSATPTAITQIADGSRSGVDTNIAGGAYNIKPGASTGSATNNTANVNIYQNVVGTTGTGAQVQALAMSFGHTTAATLGSANSLFDVVLPSSLDFWVGTILPALYGDDGTHVSVGSAFGNNGMGMRIQCANQGGTVTCNGSTAVTMLVENTSAGSLALNTTATESESIAGTTVTIRLTGNNGTGVATTARWMYTLITLGTVSASNFRP